MDVEGNGVYDSGELGISNINIHLINITTQDTLSTLSDGGTYVFQNVDPGTYVLYAELPFGFKYTPSLQGSDASFDSDFDENTGLTAEFMVEEDTDYLDFDLGLYQAGSIGDFAWFDVNQNGVFELVESPAEGLEVILTDADGNTSSQITDASGVYTFSNLDPGMYSIELQIPIDYTATTATSYEVDLQINEFYRAADFGVFDTNSGGTIEDCEYNISQCVPDNSTSLICISNCSFSETGLAIIEQTSSSGVINFENDSCFSYTPAIFTSSDIVAITACDDLEIDLQTCETFTFDLAIGNCGELFGLIDGFVFRDLNQDSQIDAGENGIEGIELSLSNSLGETLTSTLTNASGFYEFPDIAPNDSTFEYIVSVVLPDDFTATSDVTVPYPLIDEGFYERLNFGMYSDSDTITVVDTTSTVDTTMVMECLAMAGQFTSGNIVEVGSGQITTPLIVSGQNEDLNLFYIITIDTDTSENISLEIVSIGTNNQIDLADAGVSEGSAFIYGLSTDIDLDSLNTLAYTSIDSLQSDIDDETFCGNLTTNSITVNVLVGQFVCQVDAGSLFESGNLETLVDGTIPFPSTNDANTTLDYLYYFALTDNTALTEDRSILVISSENGLDLSTLTLDSDTVNVYGISAVAAIDVSEYATVGDVNNAIQNGFCIDISDPLQYIIVDSLSVECIANAGELTPNGSLNITQNDTINTPETTGLTGEMGYSYFFVLAADTTSDAAEEIIEINADGEFDLAIFEDSLETVSVYGVSAIDSIDLQNLATIADIDSLIASGACLDISTGINYTFEDIIVTDTCQAAGGAFTSNETIVVGAGEITSPIIIENESDAHNFFYIVVYDTDTLDLIFMDILIISESNEIDFGQVNIGDQSVLVFGFSTDATLAELNTAYGSIEQIQQAIDEESLCGDFASNNITINVSGSTPLCNANAGIIAHNGLSFVQSDSILALPIVSGQTVDVDYDYYYVLTDNADTISNRIILAISEDNDFDLSSITDSTLVVYGVSALNTVDISNHTTIGELASAIVDGDCMAISEGIEYSVVDDLNGLCFANAGLIESSDTINLAADQTTPAIEITGGTTENGFFYYYIVTSDAIPDDGIENNLLGIFGTNAIDLSTLPSANGIIRIFGFSTDLDVAALQALNVFTLEELQALISDETICGDITDNAFVINLTEACFADAGTLNAPLTNIYATPVQTEAYLVGGATSIGDFNLYYVLTTDLINTDDILYNIIAVQDTGSFDLPLLGLGDGNYIVFAVSTELTIDEFMATEISSIDELNGLILDGSNCADVSNGETFFVGEDLCEANGGNLIAPDVNTYTPEQTTLVSTQVGFNINFSYFFILAADLDPATGDRDIIAVNTTGIFDLSGFEVPDGDYHVYGLSFEGTLEGYNALNYNTIEDIGAGIIGSDICADLSSNSYQFLIEEGCSNDLEICVDEFFENPNPTTICPTFCNLDEDDFAIIDVHSSFNCSVEIVNDSMCFTYLPLPLLPLDQLEVVACNSAGVCDTVNYDVSIGCQVPMAENDDIDVMGNANHPLDVLANDFDICGSPLHVSEFGDVPFGGAIVSIAEDSSHLNIIPNPGFIGEIAFTYLACNECGECESAIVSVTVLEVTDLVANTDSVNTGIGDQIIIDALANDTGEGDLEITFVDDPENGTTEIINGMIVYTPDEGFEGTDTFTYTICDDFGNCTTGTIVVTVGDEVTTAPIANDFEVDVEPGITSIIDIFGNVTELDGDSLTITEVFGPNNGTIVINDDGTISYTPDGDFVGADTLTYVVCDNEIPPQCDTAMVVINVGEQGILAVPDYINTVINTTVLIDVLSNDLGMIDTIVEVTQPEHGSIIINLDNIFEYTPELGYVGPDYFFYTICDAEGNCSTTIVGINVFDDVNQPPSAGNNTAVTESGIPVDINVLNNDNDPENGTLTVTDIINGPGSGTVVINDDGTLTYTPDSSGIFMFDYVVCDDGEPPLCDTATVVVSVDTTVSNLPPNAVDDTYQLDENDFLIFNVTDNDSDPEGGDITVKQASEPLNGTIELDPDGLVQYTPNADFVGNDYFIYIICDNGNPALADTAYVTLVVEGVLDPSDALDANPDLTQSPINTSIPIFVLENDVWSGDVIIKQNTEPQFGLVVLDSMTNSFVYVPGLNYEGDDYFMYWITDDTGACDSTTVLINIFNLPNQAPIAYNDAAVTDINTPVNINVTANDSDPENLPFNITEILNGPVSGTAEINEDGTVTYTPDMDFEGYDSFSYVICDEDVPPLCDTALVVIAVGVEISNNPPTAVDDNYTVDEGNTVFISVLGNDFDIDDHDFALTFATETIAGTLDIDDTGNGIYTNDSALVNPDVFFYIICDNGNPFLCDTAVVTITINTDGMTGIVLDAEPDIAITFVNTSIDVDLLGNDTGEGIAIASIDQPEHGTFIDNMDGTITYTPENEFTGIDNFYYSICDVFGECDSTLIAIEVYGGDNLEPITTNDCIETDSCITFNVFDNDIDPAAVDQILVLREIGATENGGIVNVLNLEGDIEYCPPPGFTGIDFFTYQVCDGFGDPDDTSSTNAALCDIGTVVIKVNGALIPNHAPIAQDTCIFLTEEQIGNGQNYVLDLSTMVTDQEDNSIIYQIGTRTSQGDVAIDALSGTMVFDPIDGYTGLDHFTYIVCDDGLPSLCDTAYVKFNITDDSIVVDDEVVAVNDTIEIQISDDIFSTTVDLNVLLNDILPDVPVENFETQIIADPLYGTLVNNGFGSYTYSSDSLIDDHAVYELCYNEICDTATIYFIISSLDCQLIIKNGISPNRDGVNEYFNIESLDECYGAFEPEIIIFNRWGNVVYRKFAYSGKNDASSWSGTYDNTSGSTGLEVPDGTYYYILKLNTGNPEDDKAGYIEVLR